MAGGILSMYDTVFWPLFFAYYQDTTRSTEVNTASETFSSIDWSDCLVSSSYQRFKISLGSIDHIFRHPMINRCHRLLVICKCFIKQLFSFKVTNKYVL